MERTAIEASAHSHTERRISWLTLAFGGAAAAAAVLRHARAWSAGLAIGAALAWLNFRWLRRGLDSLVRASTAQADRKKAQVPLTSYGLALLRYVLLGLAVYVIFEYLHVPLASMILGLCALGAAALAASVYEIWHPVE
ncbi:MAG TPA: ATP synthase subunit I [Candidatus Methylomirabilis sp.]|nr:ATP synthase subunit I [Candidatus Methylomirabilis sp.]